MCDQPSTTCLDDCQQYDLTNVKNQGGLQKRAVDVVKICKLAKLEFHKYVSPTKRPASLVNIKDELTLSVLTDTIGIDTF